MDGISLVPLVSGKVKDLDDRPLFWHFPAYLQSYQVINEQRDPLFRSRPCGIIRVGDWKLHEYFEDGGLELYNLRQDIGETRNLSRSNPEKTAELLDLMRQWRSRVDAPVPTAKNPEFDAASEAAAIAAMLKKRGEK